MPSESGSVTLRFSTVVRLSSHGSVGSSSAMGRQKRRQESKPPLSYNELIAQALASANNRTMVLSEIYAYIRCHYAFFRTDDDSWKVLIAV